MTAIPTVEIVWPRLVELVRQKIVDSGDEELAAYLDDFLAREGATLRSLLRTALAQVRASQRTAQNRPQVAQGQPQALSPTQIRELAEELLGEADGLAGMAHMIAHIEQQSPEWQRTQYQNHIQAFRDIATPLASTQTADTDTDPYTVDTASGEVIAVVELPKGTGYKKRSLVEQYERELGLALMVHSSAKYRYERGLGHDYTHTLIAEGVTATQVHHALQRAMGEIRQSTKASPVLRFLAPEPTVDPMVDLSLMFPAVFHESVLRNHVHKVLRIAQPMMRLVDFWTVRHSVQQELKAELWQLLIGDTALFQNAGGRTGLEALQNDIMAYLQDHHDAVLVVQVPPSPAEFLNEAAELIWPRLQRIEDFRLRLAEPSNNLDGLLDFTDGGLYSEARMTALDDLIDDEKVLQNVELLTALLGTPVLVKLKPRVVAWAMQLRAAAAVEPEPEPESGPEPEPPAVEPEPPAAEPEPEPEPESGPASTSPAAGGIGKPSADWREAPDGLKVMDTPVVAFCTEHEHHDYPSGGHRTTARWYIQSNRSYGQRICRTTKHPISGRVSKPKCHIYEQHAVLALGDDGHVYGLAGHNAVDPVITVVRGTMHAAGPFRASEHDWVKPLFEAAFGAVQTEEEAKAVLQGYQDDHNERIRQEAIKRIWDRVDNADRSGSKTKGNRHAIVLGKDVHLDGLTKPEAAALYKEMVAQETRPTAAEIRDHLKARLGPLFEGYNLSIAARKGIYNVYVSLTFYRTPAGTTGVANENAPFKIRVTIDSKSNSKTAWPPSNPAPPKVRAEMVWRGGKESWKEGPLYKVKLRAKSGPPKLVVEYVARWFEKHAAALKGEG